MSGNLKTDAAARYEGIQVLRFFAALAVAIYHGAPFYQATGGALPLRNVFAAGFVGVDVFFVISGFVMWVTTNGRSGLADSWGFAFKRLTRVYLTWWLVAACVVAYFLLIEPARLVPRDIPRSLLLIPLPLDRYLYPLTWTLSFEVYFYAMLTFAIAIGGRRMLWVPMALVVCAAMYQKISGPFAYGEFLTSPFLLQFMAGCGIGWLAERKKLADPAVLIATGIFLLLGLGVAIFDAPHFLTNGGNIWYRITLLIPISAMLVAGFAALDGKYRFPTIFVKLGDASYSIYLWHFVIFMVVRKVMIDPEKLPPVIAELTWVAVGAFVCWWSLVFYRRVEAPILAQVRGGIKIVSRFSAASQR